VRIGIIEDDEGMRESLEALLQVSAFDVLSYDCAEALIADIAQLPSMSALIIDQNLPGMSGTEMLRQLMGQHPLPPAILISAEMTDKLREDALTSGAVSAMEKPIRPQDLIEALRLHAKR